MSAYGVPTLLFSIDGDEARGSGRSVGSVNLFEAVESTSDLLTRFGGHGAAVGGDLAAKNLAAFAERLCAYMDKLPERDFRPMVDVDACVELDELTLDTVAMLDMLAPFGQENPVPTFLARNVTLVNSRAVEPRRTTSPARSPTADAPSTGSCSTAATSTRFCITIPSSTPLSPCRSTNGAAGAR